MNLEKIVKIQYQREQPSGENFALLEAAIISRISKIEKHRVMTRFVVWVTVSVISLGVFVFSGLAFYQEFITSGSKDLVSILLTDTGMVVANRNDFIYSLAESLPLGSLAAVLSAVAVLLLSVRSLAKSYVKKLSIKLYGHQQTN